MKTIAKSIVVVIVFFICLYIGFLTDREIINWILSKVPETGWIGLIEIGLWLFIGAWSVGLILAISFGVAAMMSAILFSEERERMKKTQEYNGIINPLGKKSKWMQRVEESMAAKEARDKSNF